MLRDTWLLLRTSRFGLGRWLGNRIYEIRLMNRPYTANNPRNSPKPKIKHLPQISQEQVIEKRQQLNKTLSESKVKHKALQLQLQQVEQEKQYLKPKEEASGNQSWLGIKLKIQINQLNWKIEEKERAIKELKKNMFYTKADEVNVMIDYLNYCSSKLRSEQPLIPNDLEDLKLEIQELEITKKLLDEQSENLAIQKNKLEKHISQQYMELDQSKAELKERERDLRYLKKEIIKYEEKQKDVQQNFKVSEKKKKDLVDIDDKKAEIIEKDQYINTQEQIINQLKEKLQERTNYELRSKNALIDEFGLLQSQVFKMKEELKNLNTYYQNEIQPLETEDLPIIQGNKDHTFTILHDVYNKQEKKYPRAPRVRQEQIADLGKELSLRLQLKQIPIEKAASDLVNQVSSGSVKVEELQEQLLQEPFTIADPNDAKLLARYMIEDGNEDFVTLDPENSAKVAVVKSVFRNLVGCYTLMNSETDKQLWDEITGAIHKYETSLKNQFDLFNKQTPGFMKPKDLFFCLDQLFLELTMKQKEYVLLRLFAYTNNINKIMHQKIFDVFKPGAYIDRINKDSHKKKPRQTVKGRITMPQKYEQID